MGEHKEIKGIEHIDKVIDATNPIGRTPRSNLAPQVASRIFATGLQAFQMPKPAGYKAGRFSLT